MSNDKIKMTSLSFRKEFVKPDEEKDRALGFIKWGKKNDYPYFLIDLFNGSAWHQGIIKTKTFYIAGGGLESVVGNMQEFIENQYSPFDMNEIAEQLAFDFELFGAFAVKGTWNREGTRVAKWEYLDVDAIRMTEDERIYYLSDDWTAMNQSAEKTNLRMFPALDENNRTGQFIIYYKEPSKKSRKEKGIYPKPTYNGGLTAIQTDCDIAKFHMYELQNGFKSGTLINMPSGFPESSEELHRITESIKGRTQSVEDAGEIIITFSDGKDLAPTVQQLNGNDLDKRYEVTALSVQQNILVAHSVTAPTLFGVMQQGSFNAAESGDLFEIFKTTYVSTRQKRIEWMLNYMVKLGGYIGKVKLVDVLPLTLDNGTTIEPVVAINPTDVTVAPVDVAVDVAKSALNGSQIASLIAIAAQIVEGTLTSDSALNIILASFPSIDETQARKIVGLPATALSMCKHTSFTDDEISVFEKFGESQDNYKILSSHPIAWDTSSDEVFARQDLMFETIGEIKIQMKDFDKNVLNLLKKGEDSTSIAKALNTNIEAVAKSINQLSTWELYQKGNTTNLGDSLLKDVKIEIADFEVRYSYQTRNDVPAVKTESREFCLKLISLNRSYSRQDIDSISSQVDRNVWTYKGGYYTNPDTQKTSPWCRHEWIQQLVVKQK
jgi:hypothetical protein